MAERMRTISWGGSRGSRTLHIEAPGCIVNITKNLHDSESRQVTRVDVKADQFSGDTQWVLPEFGNRAFVGIRVMENPPQGPSPKATAYMINAEEVERLRELATMFYSTEFRSEQLAILAKVTA